MRERYASGPHGQLLHESPAVPFPRGCGGGDTLRPLSGRLKAPGNSFPGPQLPFDTTPPGLAAIRLHG
jgi:hypothetical protein